MILKSHNKNFKYTSIFIYIFVLFWVLLASFPFLWTFWGSFKVELDFFSIANWTNAITGENTKQTYGSLSKEEEQSLLIVYVSFSPKTCFLFAINLLSQIEIDYSLIS